MLKLVGKRTWRGSLWNTSENMRLKFTDTPDMFLRIVEKWRAEETSRRYSFGLQLVSRVQEETKVRNAPIFSYERVCRRSDPLGVVIYAITTGLRRQIAAPSPWG